MRTLQSQCDAVPRDALNGVPQPQDICSLNTARLQKAEFQHVFISTGAARRGKIKKNQTQNSPGLVQGSKMTLAAATEQCNGKCCIRSGQQQRGSHNVPICCPGGRLASRRKELSVGIFRSSTSFSSARFAGLCAGHKGTVFPQERGGFVTRDTSLFFPTQNPSERRQGVIQAGS